MPGRKRAVSFGSQPESKDFLEPEAKRDLPQEDAEEVFVEVELDEIPSTSSISVAPIEPMEPRETAFLGSIAAELTQHPALEENVHMHIPDDEKPPSASKISPGPPGTRTSTVRKPLPTPRLTLEKGQSSSRSHIRKSIVGFPLRGARTRAQSVHQSIMEHVVKEESQEDRPEDNDEVEETFECELCGTPLNNKIEIIEHKRAFHRDIVEPSDLPSGSLVCAHPHCSATFPDVAHLVAHLVAYHNQHQYRIRKITFDTIDRFEHWQKDMEKNARCSFLSTSIPEGDSTDLYKVDMYCEFCDDWRVQDGKGVMDAHQIMRKLIGCPAHFTATVDNRKDKAVVVGCFAHLGHHKKLSWSAMPNPQDGKPVRLMATTKCGTCGQTFRSRTACSRHQRTVHESGSADPDRRTGLAEVKMPSLECGDPECDVLCDSMATLVHHVSTVHKRMDLTVEEYKFDSLEDFEAWKTRIETDTCARFCKVSGRVLPNEVTKYFLCHLSGHTNRTKKKEFTPQDKQRNRPTKKMGRYCTAHMNFKLNKIDNTVTVRGCLGHFGHSFDVRRLPLPEQVRKEVSDLLLKGMIEEEIMHLIRGRYSEEERGYWIQRYEIRNIMLKLQREGLLMPKAFLSPLGDDDGRMWDEMGFPEEAYVQVQNFIPVEPHRTRSKLVQYKAIRAGRGITLTEVGSSGQGRYGSRKQMVDPMEPMVFVDEDGEYTADELVEMQQIEGDVELDEQVYYEHPIDVDDLAAHEEEIHVNSVSSTMTPGRKRMPLLKEPMRTGNPVFDDVYHKMKDRFNKISHQLKCTQDVSLAHNLLKELKELQARMGIHDDEMVVSSSDQWNDDYYEEYRLEQPHVVGHEEEVNEDGFDYMDHGDDIVQDGVVDAEEIVS